MSTFADSGTKTLRAPRREHLVILLLLWVGISMYGSWVPFQFVSKSLSQALADFGHLPWYSMGSRSDWAANVLLFLPAGFLGTGILHADRRELQRYWLLSVLLVTVLSGVFSVFLEFSQEWFPDRVPSVSDISAQTIGAFWGGVAWIAIGQPMTEWARRWSSTQDAEQRLNNVLLLGVVSHVLSLALPLDLTIRPSDLWQKYRQGRIHIWPFQDLVPEHSSAWFELTFLVGGSLLAGWLMARLLSPKVGARARKELLQLILAGIAFCATLEFMQLLVYSRSSKIDDVILGTVSFVAGGLFLPRVVRCDPFPEKNRFPCDVRLVLGIYLIWLGLFYWWPLNFSWNFVNLTQRIREMIRVPFVLLMGGSYAIASAEILRKTCLFAVLGLLMAHSLQKSRLGNIRRWSAQAASWGATLLVGIMIEVGQLALPGRTADLTDILLYALGAGCGTRLAVYLCLADAGIGQREKSVVSMPP